MPKHWDRDDEKMQRRMRKVIDKKKREKELRKYGYKYDKFTTDDEEEEETW